MKKSLLALGCCLVVTFTAAAESTTNRPSSWAQPVVLDGVPNLHKVSDQLYRSAQPTAEGMRNLKQAGIATIVNLRSFHSDRDEIGSTGLGYEHIYMKAWHPEREEIVRFLQIASDPKRTPVLVHCLHGADRTGTMCALYRIAVQGWTKEAAIREMSEGGFNFHSVFGNLPAWIEDLDMEAVRRDARLQQQPEAPRAGAVAEAYSNRSARKRELALLRYGGETSVELAVVRALRWLSIRQSEDGSWGKPKTAITSLALLAYLGHGDVPGDGEFGLIVQKALDFVLEDQELDGHFKSRDGHDYTQPIATIALAEAYGMTGAERFGKAMTKAVKPIIAGQNESGGFNYNLKPSSRNDTSYMGWCVQALTAVDSVGRGVEVEGLGDAMRKAIKGFQLNYGERDGSGGFGYTGPGNSTSGLTGVGVFSLEALGAVRSRECRGGLAGLSDWEFNWDKPRPGSFLYYMYYVTQAKFHAGGPVWWQWKCAFADELVKNQKVVPKGNSKYVDLTGAPREIGSWQSPAQREHTGGNPEVDTILCTLMLEVFYRHPPVKHVQLRTNGGL